MEYTNDITKYIVMKDGVQFNVLESGDISTIEKNSILINLLQGNNLEGSCSNIYLRIFSEDEIYYTKLIGINSPSKFYVKDNQVYYKGVFRNIEYLVVLTVIENMWFWNIELQNLTNEKTKVDIIYGQDVAIAHKNSVRNNEAYVCQYLDHKVFKNNSGYTVCTRQNQGIPHYLQQGSISKNIAYSTDGFQFFGLDYKVTNIPNALLSESLDNRNYQYEFAYTALQSEKVELVDKESFCFYGLFADNIPEVTESIRFETEIYQNYKSIKIEEIDTSNFNKLDLKINFNNLLTSQIFSDEELMDLYPEKRHIEQENGKILSFFTGDSNHVVLKTKEALVERPHGHMIITGNNMYVKEEIISSTNYIFGVFNSHVVVGNTNFHKLTSNLRNPLNVAKISGQRIFIEIDGEYKLLGVPSVYELGINYAKWIYKIPNDIITIVSMVCVNSPELILKVKTKSGKKYNFIVTNHVVLGGNEYEHPFTVNRKDNLLEFIPDKNAFCVSKYPKLKYKMIINEEFTLNNDSIFYQDLKSRNEVLVNLCFTNTNSINIITQGCINGESIIEHSYDLKENYQDYLLYIKKAINNFHLMIDNDDLVSVVDKFNDLVIWYTHNALIHYASPHGLEQYNGAAWGTRDVCQGPVEFFLATHKFDVVRDILLKVYSHQFIQNGDFPQWFMFDKYFSIQARDSHGDIIVWPLRTLAVYLLSTNDFSILNEEVCFTDLDKAEYTEEKATVLNHVIKEIQAIKNSFIPGTHLSCYGGGDWDDTLQPANKELTKSMVSGWTTALTFEAIELFSLAIKEFNKDLSEEYQELATLIKEDYLKFIVKDNIPSGFILFENDDIKYMLHPEDKQSGLNYRLLPFNQGIIGELFDKKQAEDYCEIIDKYLKHPDGVRLMDKPVQYKGGINTYFTRAETAANFGREIGLLYIHAHIRYVEAMAKLGKAEEAFKNLLLINPINIQDEVPNALRRQSNTYFSSSDANFYDRYEAQNDFDKVRNGEIGVKGGWRIYSSGPGIYINQLITNILGVKVINGQLVIDPVLPKKLHRLIFTYQFEGKNIEITYHVKQHKIRKVSVNNKVIELKKLKNKYRDAGIIIDKDLLNLHINTIVIYM